jgi:hypothetical protein
MVLNRAQSNNYMQVVFRMTHWVRMCLLLNKENEMREKLKTACSPPPPEMVIMEIFGWKFHNRKVLILFEQCSSFYPLFPLTQLLNVVVSRKDIEAGTFVFLLSKKCYYMHVNSGRSYSEMEIVA